MKMRGRSLVELLVALAIALVLLACVLTTVLGIGTSSRHMDAVARLGDEGHMTLSLLDAQLRMAGYATPRVFAPRGAAATAYEGVAAQGCDHGFVVADISRSDAPACATASAGTTSPAALRVMYEADAFNTWPSTAGLPTDCMGSQIAERASALGGAFVLAENRFFIRTNPGSGNPALYCAGSGGLGFASQPLVDNVEDFTLVWGIAADGVDVSGVMLAAPEVVRYVTATELDALHADDERRWSRVVSVRICVLLRTSPGVVDETSAHIGCAGNLVMPADASQRRLRRAFAATVHLRNRGQAI